MDGQKIPTNHQNRAIGRPWLICVEMLGGFERMCFWVVFGLAKSLPQTQTIRDFDRQFDPVGLLWSGSAGEAACQGRERVGVLTIEEYLLSDSARRTEGGGGSTSQATTGRACCALYIRNSRKECKIHGFRGSHTLDGAKGRQK